MKRLFTFILKRLPLLLLLSFISINGYGQEINYKFHSVFVYNFLKHVNWPDKTINEDFIIGVIGDSPIYSELETLSGMKKVGNSKIIVKKVNDFKEIHGCHMVYITNSGSKHFKDIVDIVGEKPILLVTEREGFAKKGAAINFVILENNTIKFELNKATLEKQKLKMSSDLQKLALIVG
jgi:hypothetical protein